MGCVCGGGRGCVLGVCVGGVSMSVCEGCRVCVVVGGGLCVRCVCGGGAVCVCEGCLVCVCGGGGLCVSVKVVLWVYGAVCVYVGYVNEWIKLN